MENDASSDKNCPPRNERKKHKAFQSGLRKRGVEFKGGSLHDGFGSFDGLGASGEHLTLFLLVLPNTAQ